jgi:hypothetical protein
MLHREAFVKRKRDSQSQPPEDGKTADAAVKDSRCALPPPIENDLRIIAKNSGLTHCEQLVVQGIEYKKLEAECQANENKTDDRCKYFNRK